MTVEFLELCEEYFIRIVQRTPNCSTIIQFEDLLNFWLFKNNRECGWYKVQPLCHLASPRLMPATAPAATSAALAAPSAATAASIPMARHPTIPPPPQRLASPCLTSPHSHTRS